MKTVSILPRLAFMMAGFFLAFFQQAVRTAIRSSNCWTTIEASGLRVDTVAQDDESHNGQGDWSIVLVTPSKVTTFTSEKGEVLDNSAGFASAVLDAHAAAMQELSTPMEIEIGGLTFTPGTYRSGSAINFAHGTVVTLEGLHNPNPDFLFIADSTLVTAADTSFILINGAKAENVYWALGTAATLGANSVLEGSILAGTAITFGTKSELHGCALAQSAVTFESEGSVVELDHYNADGHGNLRGLQR